MVNLSSSSVSPSTKTHPHDSFAITIAPLSLEEAYSLADDQANGAIVLMSGTVRNQTDGIPVEYLEYQAYQPMAIAIFNSIAAEIRRQWQDVNRIVIHHRVGKLKIGEISVIVAVGCPHRGEAFAACRYAIDTLKHNAPIWKKEWFEDGASTWVSIGACEQDDSNNC
ncbi:molybdenum cofactor biosynthesis protein MoaE [Pleurocapsa sp. PCC 7319]|uniref:molybdenum cofactor biosynthesis protein MoaE n=1 Tax=Pleurocapsa sp. PCC 7319 TaxID=118161 RepID=UPI0003491940|nr:molybdenum cofactor biosynthesis protein MoaE [Pleurocapsa sp. PCC 7319]